MGDGNGYGGLADTAWSHYANETFRGQVRNELGDCFGPTNH